MPRKYGEYTGPRILFWKLKEGHSEDDLINYLFKNNVPHTYADERVLQLDGQVKSALEEAGWEFEKAEIRRLSDLSFADRVHRISSLRNRSPEEVQKRIDKLSK